MKKILFLATLICSLVANAQDVKLKDTRQEELSKRATQLGNIDENTKIYLRGSLNRWEIVDEFVRIADGVYIIENYVIFNGRDGFKIASSDWHTVDLGGLGTNFKTGEPNSLKIGGDNIFIDGISGGQSIRLSRIVLDLNQLTLTLEKSVSKYPRISLNYPNDTEFMTNDITIVPTFNPDVVKGMIKIVGKVGQQVIEVKSNEPLRIGANEPFETTITLVLIAIADDGVVRTDTVCLQKSEPTNVYVYFNNVAGWDVPYCYLWSLSGDRNYPWPGEPMQWDANVEINGQKGWWKTQVSKRYSDFGEVIFNNNETLQTDDDLSMEGTSMYYDGKNWKKVDNICQ